MQVSFDLVGRVVVQAKDETGRAIASSWRGLGRPHWDSVRSMITLQCQRDGDATTRMKRMKRGQEKALHDLLRSIE